MVEPLPSAAFVSVEANFLLRVLVVAFDAPSRLGEDCELGEWSLLRQAEEEVVGGSFLAIGPFHDEPFLRSRLPSNDGTMRVTYPNPGEARSPRVGRVRSKADRAPRLIAQLPGEHAGLNRLMLAGMPLARGATAAFMGGERVGTFSWAPELQRAGDAAGIVQSTVSESLSERCLVTAGSIRERKPRRVAAPEYPVDLSGVR